MQVRELLELLEGASPGAEVFCSNGPHEFEVKDVDYDDDEELLEITIEPSAATKAQQAIEAAE